MSADSSVEIYVGDAPVASGNPVPVTGASTAGIPTAVAQASMVPLGYQKLTVDDSVDSLTVPAGATHAIVACETAKVRWRDDGSNPTATDGMPLEAGDVVEFTTTLSTLRFLRATGTSATLHISYYRRA